MLKRMLINADHPEECRVVIVENGILEEFIVEHSTRERLKGNVYQGVITRVEPAIEAAFVDFGGKKFGFLPFKDVQKESYLQTRERKARIRIQDVLIRGQRILVQVVKEGRDAKGPTLTNFLTIPGRFLVLMTGNPGGGVSRKIEDESERKKLKEIVSALGVPDSMGVIIRTAGLGRTKAELQKDFQMLMKIWETIQGQIKSSQSAPQLVYQVPDLVVRTVRDHYSADTDEIIVDNPSTQKTLRAFFKLVMPRLQNRVKLHTDTNPIFSHYKIEEQIESIFKRRVDLPSGGSIVLDTGEALSSIDVNSGKTTSASELEETALRTNLEAADEIGRQLRLRDLGGLIVIDFIDMFQKKNKALVEKQIKNACKKDKARINMSRISKFGLLEMSRQRLSPPVGEGSFDRCHHCEGTGLLKSHSSLALMVLRKIQEMISKTRVKKIGVEVSSDVVTYLLNHKMTYLAALEAKHDLKIIFSSKDKILSEEYTYTILEKGEEKPQENKTRSAAKAPDIVMPEGDAKSSEIVTSEDQPPDSLKKESVDAEAGKTEGKEDPRRRRNVRRKYAHKPSGRKPMGRGRRRNPPKSASEASKESSSSAGNSDGEAVIDSGKDGNSEVFESPRNIEDASIYLPKDTSSMLLKDESGSFPISEGPLEDS